MDNWTLDSHWFNKEFITEKYLLSLANLIAARSNISNSSFDRTGTTHLGLPSCSSKLFSFLRGKSSSGSFSSLGEVSTDPGSSGNTAYNNILDFTITKPLLVRYCELTKPLLVKFKSTVMVYLDV